MFGSFADIAQIVFADIILSGDNALVIGMAAAGLPGKLRKRAIFIGMMMAAILRIGFAIIATQLLAIQGILLIGGLLLAWVCWRFFKDLREFNDAAHLKRADLDGLAATASGGLTGNGDAGDMLDSAGPEDRRQFLHALSTILIADISMSIDNIVAVAAIARDNTQLLIFGLALAIMIMALCASMIMRVMLRFRWLSYMGLVFLVYLTVVMLYDGLTDIGLINAANASGWQ